MTITIREDAWTRVANVDMSQTCPSGLTLINRELTAFGCRRTQFQVPQENYSRVCSRVIGYQKGKNVNWL